MNMVIELDLVRSAGALQALAGKCQHDMKHRWPDIDFAADEWQINTRYNTRMFDVCFTPAIIDFADSDASYLLAFRCLVARLALEGKTRQWRKALTAWRLLRRQALPLAALRRHHISHLEKDVVRVVRPSSAQTDLGSLTQLSSMLNELACLGVIRQLAWSPSATTKATLKKINTQWRNTPKSNKSIEVLDRKIEGLSDATKAMLVSDERLSTVDRSAIAFANILMCAPSRINEPLCMKITDRFTIDDYAKRPNGEDAGKIFQAHQLLLLKGSKGADWSAKPILNFMIDLSNACWNIILESGKRSRTLVKHYEENPDRLYLPYELESLRGKPVTRSSLWQITNLTCREPSQNEIMSVKGIWDTLTKRHVNDPTFVVMTDNPRTHRSDGQRNAYAKIPALSWQTTEALIIARVRQQIESMRRVTQTARYHGTVSEMLGLLDTDHAPYLPRAWKASTVRARLKNAPWSIKLGYEKSVFVKLGLQMIQDGELVDCYIEPHDVRRWLTTKALDARERLSDVLINKWANRMNVAQLAAYDLRTAEQKANQVAVPVPQELQSITVGLDALEAIENEFGLHVDIAVAHGDGLAVTCVDAVMQATENRPIARSGNQIIILYPNRFGVCLHQHHESPCRAYTGCSEGCNEQLTVKGHLPTNEEWRMREELNNRSIANQLQALITARQRGVADDPAMLDAHLLTLVKGVNVRAMANELIERFQEIKDQIRDLYFKNELEAAFVSHGVVTRLDDPVVPNGALIKYHNPSKHGAPGYERAIEAQCGGRKEMQRHSALFYEKYPELAPRALGLKDESHLLVDKDDDEGEKDEQTA